MKYLSIFLILYFLFLISCNENQIEIERVSIAPDIVNHKIETMIPDNLFMYDDSLGLDDLSILKINMEQEKRFNYKGNLFGKYLFEKNHENKYAYIYKKQYPIILIKKC